MNPFRTSLFVLILFHGLFTAIADQPADAGMPLQKERNDMLRRSDVVLSWGGFGESEQQACRDYGVTVWGWGPSAQYIGRDESLPAKVRRGHELGMRMIMGMVCEQIRPAPTAKSFALFEENPALMDSQCRDPEGNRMVPSWWNIDYGNGNKSWWGCANNPAYQEYFKKMAVENILAGADGLFIDGVVSNLQVTSHGGCFCDHCMKGFTEYLARYSSTRLKEMGIEDLTTFDYPKRVRDAIDGLEERFWDLSRQGKVPLFREFQKFQAEADIAFIKELIADVRAAGGEGVPVAVNACMFLPDWLIAAEFADFFVTELGMQHEPESIAILQYKIAEALHRPLAAWPTGGAVRMVDENGLHELVRIWVATAYALGVNLMIPDNMWAHAGEDGSQHTYSADREKTVPLYRMVQEHADLLDGYDAVHQALLLYSNPARRRSWAGPVHQAAFDLFEQNIPFKLALSRDEFIPDYATTTQDELRHYNLVVIPEALTLENFAADEIKVLTELVGEGKAVLWQAGMDLRQLLAPLVSLEKGEGVWLVPRVKRSDPAAPLVIHAINNEYDRETNTLQERSGLVVRVAEKLAGDGEVKTVKAVTPGSGRLTLEFKREPSGDLLIPLPDGDLWWIITVERE